MSQKIVIRLLGTLALFLGIVFIFLVYKINLLSNDNSVATAPILYIDGGNGPYAEETKEIDLRTQPLVLMDLEGEILAKKVDNKTFVRISSPSGFDTWAYFKDKNGLYLFTYLYQLNYYMNPVTLIELPYDPVSFRELNYGYFRDKNGVYHFDPYLPPNKNLGLLAGAMGSPSSSFGKLEGVDLSTASFLSLDDSLDAQTINSPLSRKVFMTDKESVYFKASRVADNKNFSLIEWEEHDEIYATNYFQAGGRVFCMNEEEKIEEISKDANSFTLLLSHHSGYKRFYAGDTEHFFIDCEALRDETGNLVDPEHVSFKSFAPLYSDSDYPKNPSQIDFFIFWRNDIFSSQGTVVVSDVEDFNSFRLLDTKGIGDGSVVYFGVDGTVYRMHEYSKLVHAIESDDPINMETFEVLSAVVSKDKSRVYYLSLYGEHFETFVPDDVASFKAFPCGAYADTHNVYWGGYHEGLEVMKNLDPADLWDENINSYNLNSKIYGELCVGEG